MATQLGLSPQTVKNTLTSINRRLGARDRLHIALVLLGLVESCGGPVLLGRSAPLRPIDEPVG
jgi:hypothetical protein